MDTLLGLRHFAKAARVGSLSAAARELGLSTATVSRSINSLEKELGFALMAKTSRGLGLTAAGAAYLPKVERLLLDLAEATALAKGVHSEPKGDLKVNSRVAVGNICLAPLIPQFLRENPEITIKLSLTNDPCIDLLKHDIDVDIRTGVLQDSSLLARKLADSRRLLVASPQYLAQHGEPKVPADLLAHNCLPFRKDAGPVLWRFRDASGAEEVIEPRGNLETDNGSVIRTALRAHLGIAHMTDWAVRADLLSRRLVQILPDFEVTVDGFHHGIYAVFMPSRSQCKKVRAFIDFMVEGFRRQAFSADPGPSLPWLPARYGSPARPPAVDHSARKPPSTGMVTPVT